MKKYKIITLCGSTKFKKEFLKVQKELTLKGNIVLSLNVFTQSEDKDIWNDMDEEKRNKTKEMLREMHYIKIDMSDEIFVINVNGYIGDATKSEIEYALKNGKKVNFLEKNRR